MSDVTNPHDKFFREVWSRRDIAADFLENYLPANVLKHLELDSLQLENRSYIDENLRDQYSDMLYSVKLAEEDTAFVYMLFEHKSYPDRYVAVQLLRYMGEIWNQYLKGRNSVTQGDLPLIIPLVVYHGTEQWEACTLSELVKDGPQELRCYLPDFNFLFSDFSAAVSPEIRGEALLQAVLRVLHTLPGGDLENDLNRIIVLLKGLTHNRVGMEIFRSITQYIFAAQDKVTVEDMRTVAREQLSPKEEEEIMTVAEKLRKEGMQEGRQEGKQEGKREGKQEGECTVLRRQLENRFGEIPPEYRRRLEQADSETLLKWSERVLTATSLEEVFAEK